MHSAQYAVRPNGLMKTDAQACSAKCRLEFGKEGMKRQAGRSGKSDLPVKGWTLLSDAETRENTSK